VFPPSKSCPRDFLLARAPPSGFRYLPFLRGSPLLPLKFTEAEEVAFSCSSSRPCSPQISLRSSVCSSPPISILLALYPPSQSWNLENGRACRSFSSASALFLCERLSPFPVFPKRRRRSLDSSRFQAEATSYRLRRCARPRPSCEKSWFGLFFFVTHELHVVGQCGAACLFPS